MSDVRTLFHRNSEGGFAIERWQDVEDIIERNKALQNVPQNRKSDFRHIASIPAVILEQWINDDGCPYLALDQKEFTRMVKRKLRDPKWKWLRTG